MTANPRWSPARKCACGTVEGQEPHHSLCPYPFYAGDGPAHLDYQAGWNAKVREDPDLNPPAPTDDNGGNDGFVWSD